MGALASHIYFGVIPALNFLPPIFQVEKSFLILRPTIKFVPTIFE
jgi:hypothetical protein